MEAQSDIARLLHIMFSWVICFFSVASSNIINAYSLIKAPDSELPGVLYTIIPLSFDELAVIVICTSAVSLTYCQAILTANTLFRYCLQGLLLQTFKIVW